MQGTQAALKLKVGSQVLGGTVGVLLEAVLSLYKFVW